MENKKSEAEEQKSEPVKVSVAAEKIVPKFCTSINIALLKNKNLVLSMIYNEGQDNVALIDRIMIDLEHAKSLNSILGKLLENIEDGSAKF